MLLGCGGSGSARDGGVTSTRGSSGRSGDVSVLRRDRLGERGREAFVFFAGLANGATGHQILKFLVSAEAQHLFATAGRIPGPEVFVHDIKELLELERCTAGEDRNQFFGQDRELDGKMRFS